MLVLQTYSLLTSRIAYFAYILVTTPALVHYICTMAIKSTCPQTLMKRALTLKYSLQVNDKRRLEKQLSIHFKSARILHLLIRISLSKSLCRSDHYRADSSMFFFFLLSSWHLWEWQKAFFIKLLLPWPWLSRSCTLNTGSLSFSRSISLS